MMTLRCVAMPFRGDSMPWNDDLAGQSLHVAASNARRLRVRAGPGTGKTFTLMRRIARLLEEGVHPEQILVSTFTRVAAADLRNVVVKLNAPGAEQVRASTIHGLCFGILGRNEVLEITGRVPRPLLDFECRFLLEDLSGNDYGNIHRKRKRLKAFESAWARLQSEQPGWPVDPADRSFQNALLDWLRFHRAMLIGELVPEALRYLRNNPVAPELNEFTEILIDEYQDLNVAEQAVVDLLAHSANLTIVGDEDQSIYSFKYAHPAGIKNFHQANDDTVDRMLTTCRRCPAWIVEISNHLINCNTRQTHHELNIHHGNGRGEVRVVQWPDTKTEANGLARFIALRVETEQVNPGRILVLSPSRMLGYAIRDALNEAGIHAESFFQEQALDGDPKKIEKSCTQQAMTLLRLVAHPLDAVALRCWCGFGSGNLRAPAWKRMQQLCDEVSRPPAELLEDIRDGRRVLKHGAGLRERMTKLQKRLQNLDGLMGQELIDKLFPDGDDQLQSLRELAMSTADDADAVTILDTVSSTITQPEMPADVDYVRVMSLYKSKGLTADLVIVIGCVGGLIPRIDHELTPEEQREALEEQRRLFYVALTRARETLVLSSFTRLPTHEAHRLGMRVRGHGQHVRTQTSRFIEELGPTRPDPTLGEQLLCV